MLRYVFRRRHEPRAARARLGARLLLMRVIPGDPTVTKLAGRQGRRPGDAAGHPAELGLDSRSRTVRRLGRRHPHGDFGCRTSASSRSRADQQRYGATLHARVHGDAARAADRGARPSPARSGRTGSLDCGALGFAAVGIAMPTFVIGILLIIVFGVELDCCRRRATSPSRPTRSRASSRRPSRDHARVRRRRGDDASSAPSLVDVGTSSFVRPRRGRGSCGAGSS